MRLFDARLMRLLTFLARKQAWLSVPEIARIFRPDGPPVPPRTLHRWFSFLREKGGFVYYPYPRANTLGLQDVLVRAHHVRNPKILGILPFAASFNAEVGLADGHSFVSQSYWVPGTALRTFEEYWETARDLRLAENVEILRSRNTHFMFSPFQETITEDGRAEINGAVDNRYFESLMRRHLHEKFEVRLGDRIAASPLVIPIVIEHIWGHYSSRHVWQAIQAKGEIPVREYAGEVLARKLRKQGRALAIVYDQWREVLDHFNEVFLQPRVFFDWPSLANSTFVNLLIRPGSLDAMIDAAMRASENSIVTALKPGLGPEGWCHISCFMPTDRLLAVLRVVDEYHKDRERPVVSIQDREATLRMFEPAFCKVDWLLFDPRELAWRFEGNMYLEKLKGIGETLL